MFNNNAHVVTFIDNDCNHEQNNSKIVKTSTNYIDI